MWLGLSLEWKLDFSGGFRDKTLGDGFKLSVYFIARGVLEQHKDMSRCCVVMSHPGHPLTLYTSAGGGWHGKHILPGACPGALLGLEHFCLPLSSPAWCRRYCAEIAAGGSPEPSEGLAAWFWKNTLPEWFFCEILLLRMVCICTHITTNGCKKSQTSYLKNTGFFFLSFPFLEIFMFCGTKKMASSHFKLLTVTCSSPSLKPKSPPTRFSYLFLPLLTYPRITKSVSLLTEAGT